MSQSLIVALSTIWVFETLWHRTTPFGVPTGLDGFYYVLQVREILRTGHPYFSSVTPLVFYLQAAVSYVVRSVAVGITVSTWIATVCMFLASRRCIGLLGNGPYISWLFAAFSVSSIPFGLFETEFIKNLWGGLFLLGASVLFAHTQERFTIVLGISFLVCAIASHETTAIFGIGLLVGFVTWNLVCRLCSVTERSLLVTTARITQIIIGLYSIGLVVLILKGHTIRVESTLGGGLILVIGNAAILCASLALVLYGAPSDSLKPSAAWIYFLTLWSSTLSAIFCSLSLLHLGAQMDDAIDRTCLTLFIVSGAQIVYALFQRVERDHVRPVLGIACAVMACILCVPAKPFPGELLRNRYPLFFEEPKVRLGHIQKEAVVIAPHGIDFLITAKYGVHSMHTFPKTQYSDLLWFVWKDDAISSCCCASENECVDLGPGNLLRDSLFRRECALEKGAKGR